MSGGVSITRWSRFHVAATSLALVASVAGWLTVLALIVNQAGRTAFVRRWVNEPLVKAFEDSRAIMDDAGLYENFAEMSFHEEIPSLPSGEPFLGILGGSNAIETFIPGELPRDFQGRLHVIGSGGCSGRTLGKLVTTLDEEKGILRPGSLLILGLWWGTLNDRQALEDDFLRYSAERWGLWSVGPERVERTGGVLRPIRMELVRLRALRRAIKDRLSGPPREWPPVSNEPDPARIAKRTQDVLDEFGTITVPNASTAALERTMQLALARGVKVTVVELPTPSWLRALPQEATWESWIRPTCARLGIRRESLADFLPDEEFFVDYIVHARITGRRRVQERLIGIIRELDGERANPRGK